MVQLAGHGALHPPLLLERLIALQGKCLTGLVVDWGLRHRELRMLPGLDCEPVGSEPELRTLIEP